MPDPHDPADAPADAPAPPPSEAPAPPPATADPAPVGGWAQTSERPGRSMSPAVRTAVTVLLLVIDAGLLFATWRLLQVASSGTAQGDAYAGGQLLGTIALAAGVGLGVRWLYLRDKRRTGTVVGLPALAIASGLLVFSFIRAIGVAAPSIAAQAQGTPRADIEPYYAAASPFAIATLEPDQASAVSDLQSNGGDVRYVVEDGTRIAALLVAPFTAADPAAGLRDFASSAGGTNVAETTVSGLDGLRMDVEGGAIIVVTDPAAGVAVSARAVDEATARRVLETVLANVAP